MELYFKIEDSNVTEVNDIYTDGAISGKFKNIEEVNKFFEEKAFTIMNDELDERLQSFFQTSEEYGSEMTEYEIKHWVSNRSFGELIDMFENGEILKPDMQREFIWDSLKCSRLIESIVIGLPIPPLFLMEVNKNEYEIIDGYQRILTLVNYVKGRPWNFTGENTSKRIIPSKLSKSISSKIAKKSYENLDSEYKRTIKRSTIPLIEFKQLGPENFESKYLIFERINTGSEKLNPMQIRKSLAYGTFIKGLYSKGNELTNLRKLFSSGALKRDAHIEAILRVMTLRSVIKQEYAITKSGLKNILNDYCEKYRNSEIDPDFFEIFDQAITRIEKILKKEEIVFKRVDKNERGEFVYSGSLNISILDSFISVMITKIENKEMIKENDKLLKEFKEKLYSISVDALNEDIDFENPFTTSTGTKKSIESRIEIMKDIIGV